MQFNFSESRLPTLNNIFDENPFTKKYMLNNKLIYLKFDIKRYKLSFI